MHLDRLGSFCWDLVGLWSSELGLQELRAALAAKHLLSLAPDMRCTAEIPT